MLLSWLNPRKEISSDSFDFHVDACIGMRNIGETFAIDRGETRCKSQLDFTRSLETFNEAKRVASDVILAQIIAV